MLQSSESVIKDSDGGINIIFTSCVIKNNEGGGGENCHQVV